MAPHPTPVPIAAYSHHYFKGNNMAPAVVPALGEAGPSSWQGRGAPLVVRSRSRTPVFFERGVINTDGSFNGSCASTAQSTMPLEAPEGSCASYFPDITAYCCSGIGGTLVEVTYENMGMPASASSSSSSTSSSPSDGSSGSFRENVCQTTNYSDALACFQLTAQTNCKAGQTGLYGVCNATGNDTSSVTLSQDSTTSGAESTGSTRATTSAAGAGTSASSSSAGAGAGATMEGQTIVPTAASTGGSNAAGDSRGRPGWKASSAIAGLVLMSVLLQA